MRIITEGQDCAFVISGEFASEYMAKLGGDAVKLYIYLTYLHASRLDTTESGLLTGLNMSRERLRAAAEELKAEGLITSERGTVTLVSLADLRYRRKYGLGAMPTDCADVSVSEDEKELCEALKIINAKYFAGRMSPSWYEIIRGYRRRMDTDVILLLFEHCEKYCTGSLKKNYVDTVADSWTAENIKTVDDLEKYLQVREALNRFVDFIKKKMNRSAPYMDSEIAVMRKWLFDYKYGEAELSLVLDWTKFNNPTIGKFDDVLTVWHKAGLKNAAEIKEYLEKSKKPTKDAGTATATGAGAGASGAKNNVGAKGNFQQRDYTEDFYASLLAGKKKDKKTGTGET